MSFKLLASPGNLILQCNCRGKILEIQKISEKFNVRFTSSERRVSYENERLFDFHGLSVLKGEEAAARIKEEIAEFIPNVVEDLSSLSNVSGIPVKIAITSVEDVARLYLDERRYLDFSTVQVEYDLGREFLKDRPGFQSERRFKLTLLFEKSGLRTVHWLESGRGEIYSTLDLVSWDSNISDFTKILGTFKPASESFQEIKNYMSAFVSP